MDPVHQTQAERLATLIDANQALAQVESLTDLLPRLLRMAQDVTGAQASSILLYKPEREVLEFSLAMNDVSDAAERILDKHLELQLGEGIAGTVAQTREPLIIADASKDERFYSKADDATGFTTRNLLCVPILYRDELLGVVQVLNAKHKQTFEREELDLLRHFANLAAVALVRARLLDVKLHQERMTVQLDAASRIQEHFLPKTPELGYGSGIHARTKPAIFVGGDFYDFIPMPDGSHIVLVVDVSGKGLPAALIGAALWARTRSLALYAPDCCTLMEHLNRDMYEVMGNAMFATLVMGRYWPDSGEMELATAGHLPPLLVGDDYVTEVGELYGQPLGIDAEAGYHTRTITLERGQSVVLLTDGVTEARNARREFFGDDRLREYLLQACRPPRVQGLIRRVESWRGNAPANDDLTLVEIYRR